MSGEVIVGLDIGTTKVCAVVGEFCPDGVEIPTILKWGVYYTFYNIKKWTKNQYPKLRTKVNSCTECGKCAEKCPYNLPVIKMLKEAEKKLL